MISTISLRVLQSNFALLFSFLNLLRGESGDSGLARFYSAASLSLFLLPALFGETAKRPSRLCLVLVHLKLLKEGLPLRFVCKAFLFMTPNLMHL